MNTKEFIINVLIDDDINTFCHEYDEQGDTSRVRTLLFNGFSGYSNQELETLIQEVIERDLIKTGE